jgi:hypothetical protein
MAVATVNRRSLEPSEFQLAADPIFIQVTMQATRYLTRSRLFALRQVLHETSQCRQER